MGDPLLGIAELSRARLALAGKSGAGKSTLARVLSQLLGVQTYSFAAPLKDALRALGYRDPFPRHLMQKLGTMMREEQEDIFIRLLEQRMTPGGAVIDDLRFRNELEWCRDNGFTIVYLRGSYRPLLGEEAAHESENQITESDADIVLEEAEVSERLRRLLKEILDVADVVLT